ncbi:testis-specific protein 10-interacting protein [Dromiciops gliroides]|uniref:testis-specific protein 10-interacting protein n=1 Tax=Dromiciops gliroides TaxID=33562 RepID=UPI001CC7D212|nr:testis-specific protein 10-interacting protein [Dromiciops gliroides]
MGQENPLLRTHQQSILAASVVKANHDARIRVPSASSEKGTAAGLLGLLSGVPLVHQGASGSGDEVLIQGRPRARSAGNARKKDASNKGKKGHEPSEAEDLIPPPPRKPSFPFQWAWESFLVDGRSLPLPSPNSSQQTLLPRRAQASALPPTKARRKSRWKAVPPSAQPANFPLYWKVEARCQDIKKQLKTWVPPEPGSQESRDCQDGQEQAGQADPDGGEEEGSAGRRDQGLWPSFLSAEKRSRDEDRGQLRKWKALHLAGFTLLRGFQRKPAKAKDPEKLLDMEILQKHLQEDAKELGLYSSQWPTQDTSHPQGEKLQAWGDVKPFLLTSGTTRTFQKRREATRTLMLDWERHKQEEQVRAEQRRAQEQRVQKQVARCLAAYGPSRSKGSGASHRKLDELRRQEKQRLAEYQAELAGIRHRVQSRPFLFQQAMQANARLSVNRRFSQVLSALGLDEEQVLAEALKDEIEEIPSKHRSSKTRRLARIREEQPLWGTE